LTASIEWVREREIRQSVLAQPAELAEICRLIERRTDPESEPVTVTGTLVSWDTVHRRFIVEAPGADAIAGKISDAIDVGQKRTVQTRYEFDLLRYTETNYALDEEKVSWELTRLTELN
jgi:hypothetical protein